MAAKINIVIADSDELFLNHLTNYLSEHVNTFEVYSFTTRESFIKFISDRTHKIDIIAFTEELMNDAVRTAIAPAKILLSDGSYSDLDEFDIVNKYQKADNFINDIKMIYAEKTGREEVVTDGDKETKIIGFYSPVGGSGKTTLALSTAYALASQGKRVFYLNAEKINSTVDILNQAPSGSMSDVYLAVKTKGANIGIRVLSNRYTDTHTNVSYINPAESSLEINELTNDEFIMLVREIEKLGEFDVVIVDFDSEFSRDKIELLSAMDKIFMPFSSEATAVAKTGLFIKELGMYDELKEIKEKIYPVLNKSNNQSNSVVMNNSYIASVQIKANIMLSPIFADIKNVFHSANSIVTVLGQIIENI